MLKKGINMVLLITILIVPLYVVFRYEKTQLGVGDPSHIKLKLIDAWK
jgi:hypothetical protein